MEQIIQRSGEIVNYSPQNPPKSAPTFHQKNRKGANSAICTVFKLKFCAEFKAKNFEKPALIC